MPVRIAPFQSGDRASWEVLARGYKDFYKTPTSDEEYAVTWARLLQQDGVFGLGAYLDGQLVGLAHYLFHAHAWVPSVCYLQDLYTLPTVRGQGVGRALIEAVADRARERGAARYYWLTQEHNATARALYDKLARYGGFVRYDYAL